MYKAGEFFDAVFAAHHPSMEVLQQPSDLAPKAVAAHVRPGSLAGSGSPIRGDQFAAAPAGLRVQRGAAAATSRSAARQEFRILICISPARISTSSYRVQRMTLNSSALTQPHELLHTCD